ncbi:Fe-only nitrogenase subunit delta [Treponema primitia]|uniref:Fe-only nitrogenase subunit delta n=1 Tax=Treponema primitia TaxID=88058 RepID=UPI0002554DB8|nr:Fe-only nitrogenase subunit delta [Treponema primitia]
MAENLMKAHVEDLTDYIMKNCLWQFHSRTWDRERQNNNILAMTSQLVCGETVSPANLEEKCYWVDAVCLVEAFNRQFTWLAEMKGEEKQELMRGLKDRIDFLTIKGSLNLELTEQHY